MIKKFLLFASVGVLFTSCLGDDDPEEFFTNMGLKSANLVIPTNGDPAFAVADVKYDFTLEHTNSTAVVSTDGLALSLQSKLSFESDPVKFVAGNYVEGQTYRFAIDKINSKVNGMYDGDYNVTDLNCLLTTAYYSPAGMNSQSSAPLGTMLVMNYEIGDKYTVKTFPISAFYSGDTTSEYTDRATGEAKTYTSNSALYGVNIDVADATADIVIYNAHFAEPMPMLTMMLKDLKVEYTSRGYYIKGENIVPLVMMDGEYLEVPNYAFNNFVVSCVEGDLTTASIEFMVAGMYKGSFTGSYIVK